MTSKWKHIISVSFVVLFSSFTLFYQLGDAPISMWDEARYANNALQFYENPNQLLVVKYQNLPDMYNTKPPLVIWLQSISIGIFGVNEWAIRFPSALFGLLTCLLLFHFCWQLFQSRFISILSVLLLLGASGYVGRHVTRTGDLDSALTFFLFSSFYFTYSYIYKSVKNYRFNLFAIFFSFFLGFLTKGIAGFFFAPVLAIMVAVSQISRHLKIKYLMVIFTSVFFSFLYYLIRENLASGYLNKVISSEIMRIGSSSMSWQDQPYLYYLQLLLKQYQFLIILLLVGAICVVVIYRNHPIKWALVLAVFYLLLISISSNKLSWYTAPLFTLFSVISVSFVSFFYQFIQNRVTSIDAIRTIQLILIIFFLYPVYRVIEKNTVVEKEIYSMEREGAFIRKLIDEGNTFDTLYVVKQVDNDIHLDQLKFYEYKYLKENKLKSIQICQEIPEKMGANILLSKDLKLTLNKKNLELKSDWFYMQWYVKH